MSEEKKKLDHVINFRATEDMYESLIKYLKHANKTISTFMREIAYDYLKFKKYIKENGFTEKKPKKKKVEEEVKVDLDQIEANKFCDGDSCELPPDYMIKKGNC